jgi:L-seryl-tRNA(Ser) seleniumtransferase
VSADPAPTTRPPSVDRLARSLSDLDLPQPLLIDAARQAIAEGRPDSARLMAEQMWRRRLQPVINATGVLLHTNLGRAPLAHRQEARAQNLELDLETGGRGSRQGAIGPLIARACGAESAMVVNNCSAALMLALGALAAGRGVSVSRGELVEIGGGFRVPDVMAQSGATLVEVGTTNRTRLADFARAETDHDIALALHVHQSNYTITGFTEATSVAELATLDAPVLADIGSGLLDAACPWLDGPPPGWLAGEPAARQTLEAGADLVVFSGDKLMGGPQAGIVAGRADLVERCARHPLARAVRPGSLVLTALQDTMLAYLRRDGTAIPFWRMASTTVDDLRARAETIADTVGAGVAVVECEAVPGGGTLPTVSIPSIGLRLSGDRLEELRAFDPPVIGRVDGRGTILDLRSVDPADDELLGSAVASVSENEGS